MYKTKIHAYCENQMLPALLDRGFGKPKVEIQNTNADFRDALEQVQKHITNQMC